MKIPLFKNKLSKISQELLLMLQKLEVVTLAIAMSRAGLGYSRATYYRGMQQLQKNGLVHKRKIGIKSTYVLTARGRSLLNHRKLPVLRTDGLATIISFDIPETKTRERRILRQYLLRNNYTLLQKSVLVSNYKLTNELKELIQELKLRPYITSFDGKLTYLFN